MDVSTLNLDANKRDHLADARREDEIIGTLLTDIATLVVAKDYRRAAHASAYLLIELAKRQGLKPIALLKKVS